MADTNTNTNTNTVSTLPIDGSDQDSILSKSDVLTHQELLKRRSRQVKQLAKVYKDHYWALMEELRIKYREYYWKHGKSPYKEDEEKNNSSDNNNKNCIEEIGENLNNNNKLGLGLGFGENVNRCAYAGCKSKPMALTRFCHPHILSDSKQKLYKACTYVIKSAQTGPVLCGKPILRSIVPALCPTHFQMAEKHVTRALKKAGLNVTSSSKLAPKFHVIVAEYVSQIQAKRRVAQKATVDKVEIKEENTS